MNVNRDGVPTPDFESLTTNAIFTSQLRSFRGLSYGCHSWPCRILPL